MEQKDLNSKVMTRGKRTGKRDIEKVSLSSNVFRPKQYDTDFFYYTEVDADWVALKKGKT